MSMGSLIQLVLQVVGNRDCAYVYLGMSNRTLLTCAESEDINMRFCGTGRHALIPYIAQCQSASRVCQYSWLAKAPCTASLRTEYKTRMMYSHGSTALKGYPLFGSPLCSIRMGIQQVVWFHIFGTLEEVGLGNLEQPLQGCFLCWRLQS